MLAGFFSWWLARIFELLPRAWIENAAGPRDGIVVDVERLDIQTSIRRSGRLEAVSLAAAARVRGRKPVMVRSPANMILVKHHSVPITPRRELDQLLRHELARITPFTADQLFWRWDGHTRRGERSRVDVTLTMVPVMALASVLSAMDEHGLKADFVEVGPSDRPLLLPIRGSADRSTDTALLRGLVLACACLALIAMILPLILQTLALHATNSAIAELQPAISQVEAIRRGIAAGDAGRDILQRESERTGDVLQVLATITRILPDDTYLTDFSLRDRQMTLSGRSASAPRLITGLSADPAIRNTAFAAPVTRIEGATSDVFSIKAEVAR